MRASRPWHRGATPICGGFGLYEPQTISARCDVADRGIEQWLDETGWATIVARQGEANPIVAAVLPHQREVTGRDGANSLPAAS